MTTNYILLDDNIKTEPELINQRYIVSKLLVQCLLEYKLFFLLTPIIKYRPRFPSREYSINEIITQLSLEDYSIIQQSEDEDDQQSEDDDDQQSEDDGSISINKIFARYIQLSGPNKYIDTDIIDLLIDEVIQRESETNMENLSNFVRYYWQILMKIKCTFGQLKNINFDSIWDSKNYSICKLNKFYTSDKIKNYLVYTNSIDNQTIDGHIFVIYNADYFVNLGWIETISVQNSAIHTLNYYCNKSKGGVSTKLFNFIIDVVIPEINKSDNPNVEFIYAFAWPIMSNILIDKFKFSRLCYVTDKYYINDYSIEPNVFDSDLWNSSTFQLIHSLLNHLDNPRLIKTILFLNLISMVDPDSVDIDNKYILTFRLL